MMALLAALGLVSLPIRAADTNAPSSSAKPAVLSTNLFPDEVLCQGTGVEVRRSQVDRAFLQYRANLAAKGQTVPEAKRAELEALLLDRIAVTTLLTNRATLDDKSKAQVAAVQLASDVRRQAGSDEAFERQLLAMGFTVEDLAAQILERAICEEVVDRELKSKVVITEDQVKQFFAENAEQMERPETVRASHILISTRNAVTDQDFDDAQKKEKRQLADKVLARARKGEDFAALVKEFSDDPGSRDKGGEYTFTRGQMVPEFEKAAFALKTNEISEVVTTRFGYHIIKLSEHTPAEKLELAKVEKDIRDILAREQVQEKLLPEFLVKLKDEAKLKYLNGAQPPTAFAGISTNTPAAKP